MMKALRFKGAEEEEEEEELEARCTVPPGNGRGAPGVRGKVFILACT
jgi:hypothetical protein